MTKLNYKEDVTIDKEALDVESVDFPGTIHGYREYAAQAERREDKAKKDLDHKEAELDHRIRTNPEEFGLPKTTDEVVKHARRRHPEYLEKYDAWIEAKYERKSAEAAIHSLRDKKDAMGYLIKLWERHYFKGPEEPRDLVIEWNKRQEEREREARQSNKLSKTRKNRRSKND